jgi:hypothetical protein
VGLHVHGNPEPRTLSGSPSEQDCKGVLNLPDMTYWVTKNFIR